MYLLCLAVISHNRPHFLGKMLDSLRHAYRIPHIQVIVSDNSTKDQMAIRAICAHYPSVELFSRSGLTQAQNYEQALIKSSARYISFLHDDDFLYLTSSILGDTISDLVSAKWPTLFHSKSISFSPETPGFLFAHKARLPQPLSLGSFPFSLPVFPCWVYPCIPELKHLLKKNLELRPFGKYSDISFLEDVLKLFDYKVSILPYYYLHVRHSGSDSSTSDVAARLRLLLHAITYAHPIKAARFLALAFCHVLCICLRKVIRH